MKLKRDFMSYTPSKSAHYFLLKKCCFSKIECINKNIYNSNKMDDDFNDINSPAQITNYFLYKNKKYPFNL